MSEEESNDITRIDIDGKELILIGTAHISKRSVEIVRDTIEQEKPDSVAVELDQQRYDALVNEANWESLDLIQIIKRKQTTFLVARLALTAFQKRMGSHTGVKPGAEMVEAIEIAKTVGADLVLADRDIRTTLIRSWRRTPFFKRASVAALLLMGMFEKNEVSEEDLEDLRESHNIAEVLDELGDFLPAVKGVLVDERDVFMAHELRNAPGKKVVAVVGAAHKAGILRHLAGRPTDPKELEEITTLPPKSVLSKMIPWLLPLIVVGIFIAGFVFGDNPEALKTAAIAWFLVNGTFGALGALLALAHPLTIVATFIAAPFTSLNPTIGAGMVAGLVQTMIASPKVRDIEFVGDDITHWTGWWKNRLSRVLLVFVFSNLGSTIGTFTSFHWLKDVF